MKVPLLNFEGSPGVLLTNFERGPGVPLLNFEGGSLVLGLRVTRFRPGVLVPLLHHALKSVVSKTIAYLVRRKFFLTNLLSFKPL